MKKIVFCLLFSAFFCTVIFGQKINDRILVVSGGGSRGAWGAGFAKRLSDSLGLYNVAFGTSTGSLMNPLILLGKFTELEKGYTQVSQKKIFDVNPFNKKGDLRWTVLFRLLLCKKTFGETNNLRTLIDEFLLKEDYDSIRSSNKKVFGVAVVDFKNGEKTIKYSTDIPDSKEMNNWMWASCNQPLFMTYYPSKKHPGKENGYFVDGGVRETVPVMDAFKYAVAHGMTEIDVIVNQPKEPTFGDNYNPSSIFKGLLRLLEIWRYEIVSNDILLATLASESARQAGDTVRINFHYFPWQLFEDNKNDLLFDSSKMKTLWQKGYEGIEDETELNNRPNHITVGKKSAAIFLKQREDLEKKIKAFKIESQQNK